MNHQNQLKEMANGAMFATISRFLVIYDNTSNASIDLQKLTKLEPLTLAWMLTIIQTPPRSTLPFPQIRRRTVHQTASRTQRTRKISPENLTLVDDHTNKITSRI
jgi:hypothetical protein